MKNLPIWILGLPTLAFTINHCGHLSGRWEGIYIDHGPYDARLPVALKINETGAKLSGKTLTLPHQNLNFTPYHFTGYCKNNQLTLWFYSKQQGPKPQASTGYFINPNALAMMIHWQSAMIGGFGPMVLERKR